MTRENGAVELPSGVRRPVPVSGPEHAAEMSTVTATSSNGDVASGVIDVDRFTERL